MSTLNLSNVENRTIVEPERVSGFWRFWPNQTGFGQTCLPFSNLADRFRQVGQVFLESLYTRARMREVYVSTCTNLSGQVQRGLVSGSKTADRLALKPVCNLSEPVCKSARLKGCSCG